MRPAPERAIRFLRSQGHPIAYSRREGLGEDGGDGPAVVILGHGGGEVGGGVMRAVAPVQEQAVGPAIKHAVEVHGFAPTQAAGVVMAGGVEPRVQAGFDAPMPEVGFQPLRRRQCGRLVMSSTVSGFWPARWRCSRAAWATKGKPAASPSRSRAMRVRVTGAPFSRSVRRNAAGSFSGEKGGGPDRARGPALPLAARADWPWPSSGNRRRARARSGGRSRSGCAGRRG